MTVEEFVKGVTVEGTSVKGIKTMIEFRDGEVLTSTGSLFGDFEPSDLATISVSLNSQVKRLMCVSKVFNMELANEDNLLSVYEIDYTELKPKKVDDDVVSPYLDYKKIKFTSHTYVIGAGGTLTYDADLTKSATIIMNSEIARRNEFLNGWKEIVELSDKHGFGTRNADIGDFYKKNLKNTENSGTKIIKAFREYTEMKQKSKEKKKETKEEPKSGNSMIDLIKKKLG